MNPFYSNLLFNIFVSIIFITILLTIIIWILSRFINKTKFGRSIKNIEKEFYKKWDK